MWKGEWNWWGEFWTDEINVKLKQLKVKENSITLLKQVFDNCQLARYTPINVDTMNEDYEKNVYVGTKPDIERYTDAFPLKKNQEGLVNHLEKIMVLKNGEWQYDTYIRSNKSIDKRAVKKYIS